MKPLRWLLASALVPFASLPAGAQTPGTLEPYSFELTDGRLIEAELVRIPVLENRASPTSRSIELGAILLRSTGSSPGNPIVFLDGNPGSSMASKAILLPHVYAFHEKLREVADVVILDYRGGGLSSPRLECPPAPAPDPGAFVSRESALRHLTVAAERCAERLRADGVDLAGYTWAEVAHDVDDIRRALGADRVDLVGFSSGTHAALATLRFHEAGIGRVVLLATEGPDHTRKLPSAMDRQLAVLDSMVRADAAWELELPDFLATVRDVLESLEREPVIVEIEAPDGGEPLRASVGRFAIEYFTARNLSGPDEFPRVLQLYASLARGDVEILARFLQRVAAGGPLNPLNYLFDGASGVSDERARSIAREAETALLGDAVNFPFPEINAAWGQSDLGPAFRAPLRSTVPAFFITGSFDGNTPPEQAESVRGGFPNSRHLVIVNGDHDAAFDTPEAADAVTTFLRGRDGADAIVVPPPRLPPAR